MRTRAAGSPKLSEKELCKLITGGQSLAFFLTAHLLTVRRKKATKERNTNCPPAHPTHQQATKRPKNQTTKEQNENNNGHTQGHVIRRSPSALRLCHLRMHLFFSASESASRSLVASDLGNAFESERASKARVQFARPPARPPARPFVRSLVHPSIRPSVRPSVCSFVVRSFVRCSFGHHQERVSE